jgi:CRP/FNR family transcriptional regulator, cyclic AMP receptor protein
MRPKTDGNHSVVSGALSAMPFFDVAAFGTKYGGVTVATLKPGYVLFRQGESTDALYYIESGQVRITVVSSQGKEGILGILDGGEFCGEGSLLDNRIRVATAACLTESVVARLERANVIRAIREDPAIAEFFVVFALNSVARLRENLISQLFDSSERRLARILMGLAHCGKVFPDEQHCVIRNVDQEALAQMIGTTRSRVNHFMNKFRNCGWIDYDSSIIRVRPALLDAVLHEESFDWDETPLRGGISQQ